MVYADALTSGWTNASPTGTSLTSTNPVRRGTNAISITSGTGKGLSLTCTARSLEGYAALAFWVNAGTSAPPPLQVGASRGGIALEAAPITVPATIGWQRVVVPFASFGISNITDLSGLRIESRVVNGATPGAFSLDDVELVGNDDFNASTTATVTLSNLSPTYDGAPKPVTATTNPRRPGPHHHLQRLHHRARQRRQLCGLRRRGRLGPHRLHHRHAGHFQGHRPDRVRQPLATGGWHAEKPRHHHHAPGPPRFLHLQRLRHRTQPGRHLCRRRDRHRPELSRQRQRHLRHPPARPRRHRHHRLGLEHRRKSDRRHHVRSAAQSQRHHGRIQHQHPAGELQPDHARQHRRQDHPHRQSANDPRGRFQPRQLVPPRPLQQPRPIL